MLDPDSEQETLEVDRLRQIVPRYMNLHHQANQRREVPLFVRRRHVHLRHGTSYCPQRFRARLICKWKHVLTPGFPTDHCQVHVVCGPATGRTYTFGGWMKSHYIPTRYRRALNSYGAYNVRTFDDL
jgi:hypothetical protein